MNISNIRGPNYVYGIPDGFYGVSHVDQGRVTSAPKLPTLDIFCTTCVLSTKPRD